MDGRHPFSSLVAATVARATKLLSTSTYSSRLSERNVCKPTEIRNP